MTNSSGTLGILRGDSLGLRKPPAYPKKEFTFVLDTYPKYVVIFGHPKIHPRITSPENTKQKKYQYIEV